MRTTAPDFDPSPMQVVESNAAMVNQLCDHFELDAADHLNSEILGWASRPHAEVAHW